MLIRREALGHNRLHSAGIRVETPTDAPGAFLFTSDDVRELGGNESVRRSE